MDRVTARTRAAALATHAPRPSCPRGRLTCCPLPGRLPAGPQLLSDPGRAWRPGVRLRAGQAASSPSGPAAGGAVTMETTAASPAQEAAGAPSALRSAACSLRHPPRRSPNGPWEKPGTNWKLSGRKRARCFRQSPRHPQGLGAGLEASSQPRAGAALRDVREGPAAASPAQGVISRFRLPAPPPAAFPPLGQPGGGGGQPRRP